MIAGIEIENGACDPDHAPFRGGLSYLIESTCVQNRPLQRYENGYSVENGMVWGSWGSSKVTYNNAIR